MHWHILLKYLWSVFVSAVPLSPHHFCPHPFCVILIFSPSSYFFPYADLWKVDSLLFLKNQIWLHLSSNPLFYLIDFYLFLSCFFFHFLFLWVSSVVFSKFLSWIFRVFVFNLTCFLVNTFKAINPPLSAASTKSTDFTCSVLFTFTSRGFELVLFSFIAQNFYNKMSLHF